MIGRQLALLSRNPVQTLLVSRAQPKIWQKIPQNWRTSVFWMFNCMWGCNGVRWMILSLSGYDCLKCIHLIFEICIVCTMKIRKSHQRENRLCLTLESSPDYLYYFSYRDLEQKLLIGEISEFVLPFMIHTASYAGKIGHIGSSFKFSSKLWVKIQVQEKLGFPALPQVIDMKPDVTKSLIPLPSVNCSKSLTDSECVGCQGSIICNWLKGKPRENIWFKRALPK